MSDKLTLEGTFLKVDKNDRWQGLYASQNYGTFYTVYGKFIFKQTDSNIVTGIVLYLVNYKGIIDLGFTSEEIELPTKEENDVLSLEFYIKGLSSINECTINFSNEIPIENIDTIFVSRVLHPLFAKKAPSNNSIFDTEFYYRNGIQDDPEIKSPNRPGYVDYSKDQITYSRYKIDIKQNKTFGGNCHTSILKAI